MWWQIVFFWIVTFWSNASKEMVKKWHPITRKNAPHFLDLFFSLAHFLGIE
jgi:hypothetical protein